MTLVVSSPEHRTLAARFPSRGDRLTELARTFAYTQAAGRMFSVTRMHGL